MELPGMRFSKDLVPRIRAECRNTRKPSLHATKIDRAKNPREITAERAHRRAALPVWLDTSNQEDRGARERRKDGLRNPSGLSWVFGCAHTNAFYVALAQTIPAAAGYDQGTACRPKVLLRPPSGRGMLVPWAASR